jgi:tetratricopeptide (TPR) repeat protein
MDTMKKIIILLAISFAGQFCFAQTTKADLDKMMKQARDEMKKYGEDSAVTSAMKDLTGQQKKVSNAMKNQRQNKSAASGNHYIPDPGDNSNVDNWHFPAKNKAVLSSVPKKLFTKPELIGYLNELYAQLSKKMPPGIASSVEAMATRYNNDASKMGAAAVAGWYTNYREESLLLIVKAAANNPDNGLLLNNCAAMLNMGGIEQKSIPLLKYLLQSYSASSMVLNNLGQAYAGLGETDTAMIYFGRCLKIEPENPEANNTAGQIEASKGNTEKAISYFEQSFKGAYSKPAELKLRRIKEGSSIVPFVKPRVKIPEYFNQFKYRFPAQCTSVENAAQAEAENNALHDIVFEQFEKYAHKLGELVIKSTQLLQQKPTGHRVAKGEFLAQPFSELCVIMYRDLLGDYYRELGDMSPQGKKGKNNVARMQSLEKEYQDQYDEIKKGFDNRIKEAIENRCCGEGNTSCCIKEEEICNAYNGLANQFLPLFAANMEDWQIKYQLVFKKYLDDLLYWGYLVYHNVPLGNDLAANAAPNGDNYRLQSFYPLVTSYLQMMSSMSTTKVIKPCHFTPATATADSNEIKETECPFELEVPFIVGEFKLDCEKFYFSAGAGLAFSYENNFKTLQSTVSVGIGLKLERNVILGPIKAGVSAGVSETIFITFDGDNKVSDAGLKFIVKGSAGVDAEAGNKVKINKDIAKRESEAGYTLGINSGWNFNEGPFKGMFGPAPAVQINKNVKM